MLRLISLLVCALLLISSKSTAQQLHINVVTEDAFPLQYQESGELKGPAVDIVKAVLEEAGLPYSIQVLPWARAYALAKTQPNTLIFSMARTPHRESLFHWLGSLMELNYYLYGLSANFPSANYIEADFKNKRIGTILDSATYQYLAQNGFSALYPVTSPRQNYEKLLSGRVDAIPANAASFKASCEKFGQDCSKIKPLAQLGIAASQLYFAMSKTTDDNIVEQIKAAYHALLAEQLISQELSLVLFPAK